MADQTIAIRLILRDELSKPLAEIGAHLRRLDAQASTSQARGQLQQFGGVVRVVHRELSTLSRITIGGLIGGGVVASIVGITKALGDMAKQGLQLHYTAQSLGVSEKFIDQMTDGLSALGMSSEAAAHSVESAISTLKEAETYGSQSNLFRTLSRGIHGSGMQLWREIREQMAGPEGAEGAFKFLIDRMKDMAPSGQTALMKALGISSLAFADLNKVLGQLHPRVRLSHDEMLRLNVANQNFKINMENVGTRLGAAVIPGVEKITKALSDYLATDAGKKFAAELKTWSDSVGAAIAKWIEEGGLQRATADLGKAVALLNTSFEGADAVVKGMGLTWPQVLTGLVATGFVAWLVGVAAQLALIARIPGVVQLLAALAAATWFLNKDIAAQITDPETRKRMAPGGDLEKAPKTWGGFFKEFFEDMLKGNIDLWGKGATPQPQSGDETPKTDSERRADLSLEKREIDALTGEVKMASMEFDKLNALLQPGGPEGGKGPSGYQLPIDSASAVPNAFAFGGEGEGAIAEAARAFNRKSPILYPGLTADPGALRRYAEQLSGDPGEIEDRRKAGAITRGMESIGRIPRTFFPNAFNVFENVRQGGQPVNVAPSFGQDWSRDIESTSERLRQLYPRDRPGALQDPRPRYALPQRLSFDGGGGSGGGFGGGNFNLNVGDGGGGGRGGGGDSGVIGLLAGARERGGDSFGGDTIIRQLAREDAATRPTRINGSATVDIDLGGVFEPPRNPNELFKPQPLEGSPQMQNVTQQADNRLSFQ
jgi:hypothetical protein